MKASKFNVIIPIDDKESLIFNTFSDSRVMANSSVIKAIENCDQQENLSNEQKKHLIQLCELGIIREDEVDEDKELEYWFHRLKFDSKTLNATILTTMACNMDCVYCFEQGVDSNLSMSKKTAKRVCEWLIERVDDVHPRDLTITFFGGEPLINSKMVKFISRTLHQDVQSKSVVLNIEIITNGLLLSPELVEELLPLGLRWIKVTLDGDAPTHNRMRPKKAGGSQNTDTYDEIIENLLKIKGKVPFIIGGNYDESTKYHIPALLDDLKKKGFRREDVKKIAFKPILGFPGHVNSSVHAIEACTFSETNTDDFFWLIKETEKRGFKSYKKIALGPCEAVRENTYTIGPSGDLYKCAAMAGRKEYSIGTIYDDLEKVFFSCQNISFMTAEPWQKCTDCKFVPICGGGCRLGAISLNGNMDSVACEKKYFENVSTRLVVSEMQSSE